MRLASGRTAPIPPQGLAELSPQVSLSYYYPEHLGLTLEREFALFGQIYRSQPWVRTVVDKVSAAVARLPVNVWDTKGDTRSLDSRSPYAKLIAKPCEYLSPNEFWRWVSSTLEIYGETYVAKVRGNNGKVISFMPMHPSRVAIKRNDDGSYQYSFQAGAGTGTGLVYFKEEDVVPFKLFNPDKLERGLSRMESIRSTIFDEDSSRTATQAMWRNSGRPNLVLSSEKQLGKEGRDRLRDAFNIAHQGSSNTGKTLVLEDGVTAVPFQLTAVEMQFIESRKLNREEVCGVYDVAPPIVHILDRATFSNISAQMRAFYRDTMAPRLEFIQDVMDFYVGREFSETKTMEFGVDDVIRGDFETRAESARALVQTGIATPNEGREFVGLDRSDNPLADELFANSAIQRLGEPAEQIRVQGELEGTTPDGLVLAAPQTTPVATLDGQKPNSVPALPQSQSAPRRMLQTPSPKPKPPAPAAATPKHLRAVKGALGRDQDIKKFALQLAAKYPNDLDDILRAVHIAIAERDKKGK